MILRRITTDATEVYFDLGDKFNLYKKETSIEEFKRISEELYFEDAHISHWIFAYIKYNNGNDTIPLCENSYYELLSSKGEVFLIPKK